MTRFKTSKYELIDLELVRKLAEAGCTEREIALELDVSQSTFNCWKRKHADFKDLLRSWKYDADAKVERSLYERATGYECVETKVFFKDGETYTHEVVKHYPPDVTACIFWLKNRKREEWRDKVDHEHSGTLDFAQTILKARKRVHSDTQTLDEEDDLI